MTVTAEVDLAIIDTQDLIEESKSRGVLVFDEYDYTGSLLKRCQDELTEDQVNEALKKALTETRKARGLSAA